MKTKIASLLSAFCFLLFGVTACTTTVSSDANGNSVTNVSTKLDPVRTANAIRAIIPPAIRIAVEKEPSTRDYLVKAQAAICLAASAGNNSPDQIKAAVAASGIREIQTPEVQAAIEAVFAIYQAYYGDVVAAKLNQYEWLSPVLAAICAGMEDGLSSVPIPQSRTQATQATQETQGANSQTAN